MNHWVADTIEFEVDSAKLGENIVEQRQEILVVPNQPSFPMLKLEIPMFDGINPRWWPRRCERMFN